MCKENYCTVESSGFEISGAGAITLRGGVMGPTRRQSRQSKGLSIQAEDEGGHDSDMDDVIVPPERLADADEEDDGEQTH